MASQNEWKPLDEPERRRPELKLDLPQNLPVEVAILGGPYHFTAEWDNDLKRYVMKSAAVRLVARALLQVWDFRDCSVHVLTLPQAPYESLRRQVGAHPIDSWIYVCTRRVAPDSGVRASERATTRYELVPGYPMTPLQRSMVASAARIDLARAAQDLYGVNDGGANSVAHGSAEQSASSSPTISPPDLAMVTALVDRMTDVAKATFLSTFAIAALAQLPAQMTAPAKRFAEQLLSEPGGELNNI